MSWLASLIAVPLLIPYRWPPALSFYQDAAALVLAAVGLIYFRSRPAPKEPRVLEVAAVASAPLALLGVITLQQILGKIPYVQHFIVPAAGLILAAATITIGQRWFRPELERAVTGISIVLVCVALAQFLWGLFQIAGFEWQGFEIIQRGSGPYRVSGIVAQANQFAVLQLWGMLGLLYLVLRRRLPIALAAPIALVFMTGAALAGSRATYIYFVFIGLGLSLWMRYLERRPFWWLPASVGLAYVPFAVGVAELARHVAALSALEVGRPLAGASTHARLAFWHDGWALFAQAPWLGVGWYQYAPARWRLAEATTIDMHADHAHNIFVNLLAEVGFVGVAVLAVPLLMWVRRIVGSEKTVETMTLCGLLAVIALYSLFEFPLWLPHFLIPCALFIGLLEPSRMRFSVSAGFYRLLAAARWALPVLIVSAVLDYARVERVYRAFFGNAEPKPTVEEVSQLTLRTLFRREAEEIFLLVAPIDVLTAALNFQMSERVFLSRPVPPLAAVHAAYLLLAENKAAAQHIVDRTCMWSPDGCHQLMLRFNALARELGSPFDQFLTDVFRQVSRPNP